MKAPRIPRQPYSEAGTWIAYAIAVTILIGIAGFICSG